MKPFSAKDETMHPIVDTQEQQQRHRNTPLSGASVTSNHHGASMGLTSYLVTIAIKDTKNSKEV